MKLEQELSKIGLSKPEIVVYLHLLEHGLETPPQVAKGTKTQRSNCYNTLDALREKQLIDREVKGKRYAYYAKDPFMLLQNLESKKEVISSALPDLRALYKAEKNKPTVKFYYGIDEVKEMFARTDDAKEILFIAPTDTMFETYPSFFKKFREQLVDEQIFVRDILTQHSGIEIAQKTREVMRGYYDFRFLEKKHEDTPASVRLWGNYIGLVVLDEPILGTVVESKALAQTFKTMFEVTWSASERIAK